MERYKVAPNDGSVIPIKNPNCPWMVLDRGEAMNPVAFAYTRQTAEQWNKQLNEKGYIKDPR
jgi:hypothetical protein